MKKGVFPAAVAAVLVLLLGLAWVVGQGGMMGPGYGGDWNGMMGPGGGMGMMGMMGAYPPGAKPLSDELLTQRLESYARRFGPGARIADVMPFSQNYYAQVVDAGGQGLAEIIVDRYSGVVFPEPGPNMVWRGAGRYLGTAPRYELEAARDLAEAFLADYLPGARVRAEQAFDGYYTFDFGREGIEGMLSVHAYTGEVWVHTWHGIYLGQGAETH